MKMTNTNVLTDSTKVLNEQREMLKLDFESTAEWRDSLSHRYPDDERNIDAVRELRKLASTVAEIPDDLMTGYIIAYDVAVAEKQSEMMKGVGFHASYDNASDFVNALFECDA